MPNKIPAHDKRMKKRIQRIPQILPKNLALARKYRSSYNWQKVAKQNKINNPLCCDPWGNHAKEGTAPFVEETHHIQPLATHYHLRAVESNLASLCHPCHDLIEKRERAGQKTDFYFKNC